MLESLHFVLPKDFNPGLPSVDSTLLPEGTASAKTRGERQEVLSCFCIPPSNVQAKPAPYSQHEFKQPWECPML